MCTHQRPSGGAVIKLSVGPFGNRVAARALGRAAGKPCGNVIRDRAANCGRALPVVGMTTHAVRRGQVVGVV